MDELARPLVQERRQREDAEQRLGQLDGGSALAVPGRPTASTSLSLGAEAAKAFEDARAVAERLTHAQEQQRGRRPRRPEHEPTTQDGLGCQPPRYADPGGDEA
ncbi:MAG TPA: hypothetical protein VF486_19565 [Actinomycetes bacterium]